MTLTRIETASDSNRFHLEKLRKGIIAQSTTTGAMTKVPAASASHQVNQVTTESEKLSLLARMNPAMAMVELIIVVGAKEMIANFAILEGAWVHDTSATPARVLWRWDNVMASSALKSALRSTACVQAVDLKTKLLLRLSGRRRP